MSDGTFCHNDDIWIDDEGSQELPSPINVSFAPSIPQARGNGSNGGTTKNKYWTYFSKMDKNQILTSNSMKLLFLKQARCLWIQELFLKFQVFTALFNPKFGAASHFSSNCNGETDTGNQIKPQYIQEAFISKIVKIEEPHIRYTQYDIIDILWCLQFMTRMIHIQLYVE